MLFHRTTNAPICYQESISSDKIQTNDFSVEEAILFYNESVAFVRYFDSISTMYAEAEATGAEGDKEGIGAKIGNKIKAAGKYIWSKLVAMWGYITGLFSRFFGSGQNNKENVVPKDIDENLERLRGSMEGTVSKIKDIMSSVVTNEKKKHEENSASGASGDVFDATKPTEATQTSETFGLVLERETALLNVLGESLDYFKQPSISGAELTRRTFRCITVLNETLSALHGDNINIPPIDQAFLTKVNIPNTVKIRTKVKNIKATEYVLDAMNKVALYLSSEVGTSDWDKVDDGLKSLSTILNSLLFAEYDYDKYNYQIGNDYKEADKQIGVLDLDVSKIIGTLKDISKSIEDKKDVNVAMKGFALPYMSGLDIKKVISSSNTISSRVKALKPENGDDRGLIAFGKMSNTFMDAMLNYDYMVAAGVCFRMIKIIQVYNIEVIAPTIEEKSNA